MANNLPSGEKVAETMVSRLSSITRGSLLRRMSWTEMAIPSNWTSFLCSMSKMQPFSPTKVSLR